MHRRPVVAVLLLAAGHAHAQSWTQYCGDASHRASVDVQINPAAIQPLWSRTAAELGQASLIAGAVTSGSHVYISAYTGLVFPNNAKVLALSKQTGGVAWDRTLGPYAGDISAPAVGNGKVYVHQFGHSGISGGNPSQHPYLVGLDALSGTVSFATSHSGQWSSGSRPTVAGTQVFAAGGYYGGINGYNGVTGATQWFTDTNQQYDWVPAADASRTYVYMGEASASPGPNVGRLYGFDRASGALTVNIANTQDGGTFYDHLTVLGEQNDVLTVARDDPSNSVSVVSFDLATQSVRWRAFENYDRQSGLAVDDGAIFATGPSQLTLLNEQTGALIDSWQAPAALLRSMIVTDTLVFVQSSSATYAVDRATLESVWSVPYSGELALGDGVLLISGTDAIHAFTIPAPWSGVVLAALTFVRRKRRRPARG